VKGEAIRFGKGDEPRERSWITRGGEKVEGKQEKIGVSRGSALVRKKKKKKNNFKGPHREQVAALLHGLLATKLEAEEVPTRRVSARAKQNSLVERGGEGRKRTTGGGRGS